jgi:PAS domain S-box-containing protein
MATRPTYEALEQKVKDLEKIAIECERAEEALRESEELYRNVYNTAPLAFVVWDLDARVTDWNRKAEEVFGWSKEEVLSRDFFGFLIPKKDRLHVERVVDRLVKGELPSHSINDNLTKDGQIITCEWNNSPLHDDDGNIVGVISLALDITERKQAEEALCETVRRIEIAYDQSIIYARQLNQEIAERKQAEQALRKAHHELERFNLELEEKVQERTKELNQKNKQLVEAERLAVLGKMANRVAHELRNPLTAIGGFARRINEKTPAGDPNKKYLQMIVEEAISMESKVSEITRIQSQ